MDILALRLEDAKQQLIKAGCNFQVKYTQPCSRKFTVDEAVWYVLRQRQIDNGAVELLVAAKMRKEVL